MSSTSSTSFTPRKGSLMGNSSSIIEFLEGIKCGVAFGVSTVIVGMIYYCVTTHIFEWRFF